MSVARGDGLMRIGETWSMAVQVTPEVERLVQTIMKGGEYSDETEVLHEALSLLQERNRLRAEIRVGLEELDRGERIDAETVFDELRIRAAKIAGEG